MQKTLVIGLFLIILCSPIYLYSFDANVKIRYDSDVFLLKVGEDTNSFYKIGFG